MKIDLDPIVAKSLEAKWRDEIERAIANARRPAEGNGSGGSSTERGHG